MHSEQTALHESGHAVAADRLGSKVLLVTIEPGEHLGGACRWLAQEVRDHLPRSVESPFITWAGGWQRSLAADVAVALAGGLAAELFAPRGTGPLRLPESVAEQAQEQLEALAAVEPAATAAEIAEAAEAVNSPAASDAEQVAHVAFVAHGGDPLRAAAWTHWLAEETRALLLANEQAVRRMAALLMAHGTLGGQAIAACLEGR